MQAMILAAGRGTRMLPLTNTIPKPLITLGQQSLIEYTLNKFKLAGLNDVVINIHHLGSKIKDKLQDGSVWDLKIKYSEEPVLLDTGGGIMAAIRNNLIGSEPFIVTSADVLTKFEITSLFNKLNKLAHLILVPNPKFNLKGDFSLEGDFLAPPKLGSANFSHNYTYANIGIFDPKFFSNKFPRIFPLSEIIKQHLKTGQITAEIYSGPWFNLGTVADLKSVDYKIFL